MSVGAHSAAGQRSGFSEFFGENPEIGVVAIATPDPSDGRWRGGRMVGLRLRDLAGRSYTAASEPLIERADAVRLGRRVASILLAPLGSSRGAPDPASLLRLRFSPIPSMFEPGHFRTLRDALMHNPLN